MEFRTVSRVVIIEEWRFELTFIFDIGVGDAFCTCPILRAFWQDKWTLDFPFSCPVTSPESGASSHEVGTDHRRRVVL